MYYIYHKIYFINHFYLDILTLQQNITFCSQKYISSMSKYFTIKYGILDTRTENIMQRKQWNWRYFLVGTPRAHIYASASVKDIQLDASSQCARAYCGPRKCYDLRRWLSANRITSHHDLSAGTIGQLSNERKHLSTNCTDVLLSQSM